MTRGERAKAMFEEGYNCAQATVLAFADILPAGTDTLMRMACSFGGGMGRLREVCGAMSGTCMILGLLYGYPGPETGEAKAEQYARVQELGRLFEASNGSLVCRELLGLTETHDVPVPEARTAAYYTARPCGDIIARAAENLERFIAEHPAPAREGGVKQKGQNS